MKDTTLTVNVARVAMKLRMSLLVEILFEVGLPVPDHHVVAWYVGRTFYSAGSLSLKDILIGNIQGPKVQDRHETEVSFPFQAREREANEKDARI